MESTSILHKGQAQTPVDEVAFRIRLLSNRLKGVSHLFRSANPDTDERMMSSEAQEGLGLVIQDIAEALDLQAECLAPIK
ncbi:MAG: hypothetical protein AB7F66_03805 [Bacteriovoracia bacterium]